MIWKFTPVYGTEPGLTNHSFISSSFIYTNLTVPHNTGPVKAIPISFLSSKQFILSLFRNETPPASIIPAKRIRKMKGVSEMTVPDTNAGNMYEVIQYPRRRPTAFVIQPTSTVHPVSHHDPSPASSTQNECGEQPEPDEPPPLYGKPIFITKPITKELLYYMVFYLFFLLAK